MVALRKETAGTDSFGNVWPEDGAVIDVPDDQAAILLRIQDAGITEAPVEVKPGRHSKPADDTDDEDGEDEPKPRARRAAAAKD